jgi:hypothetical protein
MSKSLATRSRSDSPHERPPRSADAFFSETPSASAKARCVMFCLPISARSLTAALLGEDMEDMLGNISNLSDTILVS